MYDYVYIYIYLYPMDPNTVWEGTANPLNHTSSTSEEGTLIHRDIMITLQ